MNLEDLDFLTSESGAALLARLAHEDLSDQAVLPLLTRLRKDRAPQQASAAVTLTQLRRKAVTKFGDDAVRMFFTAAALEQASHPFVSRYRAQAAAGLRVIDACCGIGADSLAMSRARADVLGLEYDPLRVAMARLNADALGLNARFEVADVRKGLPTADLIFYDPARRDSDGRRVFHVAQYEPPLSLVRDWSAPRIAVKLSPGVDVAQLADYEGGVEFISVDGDLKEALLWLGCGWTGRRATLITGGEVLHWPEPATMPEVPIDEPHGWLVEPDPALLRAGLVQAVSASFDGAMLDDTIAYFTTDVKPDSPWVRSWRIVDWMPFQLKRLRAYLRARDVGRVTVKKRGVAITPEELTGKLRLKGKESCTLVLTRYQVQPIAIICDDFTG